jgi:catechol 2,3-dioxygenase-like lactoylglutathione lyase family enzyme
MAHIFDHIDLRVPQLAEVEAFYRQLLPALGFTREIAIDGWLQFEAEEQFFGVTESPGHIANENRIAFHAGSATEVDRLSAIAKAAGARNIEGPMDYSPGYHAVFFEDPCGNRFEICYRS